MLITSLTKVLKISYFSRCHGDLETRTYEMSSNPDPLKDFLGLIQFGIYMFFECTR